jgi:hypothetical protein
VDSDPDGEPDSSLDSEMCNVPYKKPKGEESNSMDHESDHESAQLWVSTDSEISESSKSDSNYEDSECDSVVPLIESLPKLPNLKIITK